jgi:hypothetical protein
MGTFVDQLLKFRLTVEKRAQAVFVNVASATKASWTDGSPITGSPGVPVVTGNLKGSIQLTFPGPNVAEIKATGIAPDGSKVGYARVIEENLRGANIPAGPPKGSTVGGPHALALTVAGFGRLVSAEVAKVRDS